MQKVKFKQRLFENRYVLIAFLASAVILLITYIHLHIFPFGDRTILRVDLFHQYAPYLEEMRSRVANGQSLFYSWEGGLGKDFLAQTAYYTTSPLNLLYFWFPAKALPEAVAIFIMIKVSLCSSTFTYYLKKHFGKNDLSILLFGLLYGFSSYVTCFYWNIMWLDTIVLFPLVVLGLERLLSGKGEVLYYVCLALTMIVNFYLAILVSILISLYCLVFLFSNFDPKKDGKVMLLRFVRFAVISVCAAMTAAFILAPVAFALTETQVSGASFPNFEVYPNVWQLITDHFLGARASVLARNEDLPNVYTGVLTMVLLPVYLFNKKGNKTEKILLTVLMVFMLLCACIKPLDFMIHGFHFPANLPHRYTFIYSFLLLYMAFEGFHAVLEKQLRLRPFLIMNGIYIAVMCITEFVLVGRIDKLDRVLSNSDILINVLLIACYVLLILFLSKGKEALRTVIVPILLVSVIGECVFGCFSNYGDTGVRKEYTTYMGDTKKAIARMDAEENGNFYRTEFRRFITINDASLYHYNGFSQFSSLEPGGISALMEHLGVAATSNSFRYYDPTPLIDAMFDMRYVMNKEEEHPRASHYEFVDRFGAVYVYRNNQVLPLAYMTDSSVLDWQTLNSEPFTVQNDFVHKAAGVSGDLFTLDPLDSLTTENMTVTPDKDRPEVKNYTLINAADLSLIPSVHAEYTSDRDQYLYLYVDAANTKRFVYSTSTSKEDRELSAGRSLIDVGRVSKGEKVTVDFVLTNKGEFEKTYRESGTFALYAAGYNENVFREAYDSLNSEPMAVTSFRDTRVEGTVTAEKEGVLMTSIPYTRGWKVTVDGEKGEILPIGENGLAGVKIPAGTHTVIFSYNTGIFIPAVLVSLLGILCFLLLHRKWKDPAGSNEMSASKKTKIDMNLKSRKASGKSGGNTPAEEGPSAEEAAKDRKDSDPTGKALVGIAENPEKPENSPGTAPSGAKASGGSSSRPNKRKKKKKGR